MLIMLAMLWCFRRFSRRGLGSPSKQVSARSGFIRGQKAIILFALVATLAQPTATQPASGADGFTPRRLGNHALEASMARNEEMMVLISNGEQHFREGTSLPSTPGRIVMMGRRWVFVPNSTGDGKETGGDSTDQELPRGRRILSAAKIRRTSQRNEEEADDEDAMSSSGNGNQWILMENLMLQRIVRAVRSDSIDDKWVVTGRITEFFDDNYLLLESAKRSNR